MHTYSKRDATRTSLLLWCAMRDLNPHGRPPEPKSGASANSANRACFFFSPKNELERKTRFELATLALARRCSTPEPLPHTFHICKAAVSSAALSFSGDSTGNRTRVTAVKGRCLDRLTMEPYKNKTGNVLLSRAASRQVSSALRSLTAVFEMGTGVSSALLSPDFVFDVHFQFLSQTVTNLFLRYTLKSE